MTYASIIVGLPLTWPKCSKSRFPHSEADFHLRTSSLNRRNDPIFSFVNQTLSRPIRPRHSA